MDPQSPSQMPPPPAPPPYGAPTPAAVDPKVKNLAIGMFVCAALVLIGIFTSSWGSASERGADIGAGLTSLEMCGRGRCASLSWGDTPISGDVVAVGYLALLGGLASAAAGIAIGVFAMTNKPNKIPAKILNIVFGVTAFAMTFFLIRLLTDDKMKGLGISWSGIVAIGGLIGLSVLAKMVNQARGTAA
jgi:hypothetical protein